MAIGVDAAAETLGAPEGRAAAGQIAAADQARAAIGQGPREVVLAVRA